ncbi:hypothetical protein [Mucilaginibacter sp. UYCu711]|uniref:hypothetical protein n=1 Tax=Mucilaginibacter sp. UYCu711 TaxID=3156339 RepID=UPI003D2108CE
MKFETLSPTEKLDLFLNTLLVIGDGVVDDKTIAQTFHCGLSTIEEVADRLLSDGFIEVKQLYPAKNLQQISITAEGKLFTSHGGYAGKQFELDKNFRVNYGDNFHTFSRRVNRLINILLFVGVATVTLIFLYYLTYYSK